MTKVKDLLEQREFIAAQRQFAMSEAALTKKAKVAKQISTDVYSDAVTLQLYKRYLLAITDNTPGVTKQDSIPGETSVIWEYVLADGLELQFIGGDHRLYIEGLLQDIAGPVTLYPVKLEVWDNAGIQYRGTLWEGESDEINNSTVLREKGYPLVLSGDEVRAVVGDKIQLKITTPMDIVPSPVLAATSKFTLRGYQMIPVRNG